MAFRILLGSNNAKKRKELGLIIGDLDIELLIPADLGDLPEPVEDGATFEENARIKAFHYARHTEIPVLADDSGLMVDALGGQPGVFSSRYAGEEATDHERSLKLLKALEGVPDARRTARFVCCIVVADGNRIIGTSEGTCEGRILNAMRGIGGFGYDPVFFYPPEGKTFAELPPEVKNRVSHRARALAGIHSILEQLAS